MVALRKRERWIGILVPGLLLLIALGLARVVVETQAIGAGSGQIAGALLGVTAAFILIPLGPVPCVAGLGAAVALQASSGLSIGGGVNVTAADAFFVGLVVWWVGTQGLRARRDEGSVPSPIQSWPLLLFVGYMGLTLLYIAVVDQGHLWPAAVSWIRIAQVAAVGLLTAAFVRTKRDVVIVVGAYALAAAFAAGHAFIMGLGQGGPLGDRHLGLLNPNPLGFLSGMLVLLAFFPALTRRLAVRIPLGVLGCLGLVQAKSTGATAAASVALLLGLVLASGRMSAPPVWRALQAITTLVVALALAYSVIALVRPENVPSSSEFANGTTMHHLVLATAGFEIGQRNPVIGVGWTRSGLDEVIRAPEIGTALRERFRFVDTKEEYYPDTMDWGQPSVHNAYTQTFAELGLIGLALLVFAFCSVARDIARLLSKLPRRTTEWWQVWFLAWGLVLVIIYWNTAPFFGGQIENATAVLFLGVIAGFGKGVLSSGERGARPAPEAGR